MTIELQAIIFFIYTFIFSYFLHKYLLNRASKYKIKKANTSAERWSSQTKPILGGITFYVIFLFSILNYSFLFGYDKLISGPMFGAILVLNISFLMGLADDMLNTPPAFKFLIQFIGAGILIYFGISINIFDQQWLNYLITVIWFLGVMNSINMLDNMDAVTTSVSITILLGALIVLFPNLQNNSLLFIICLGALAALSAFMFFNWNPSKMYMGDNGSQFLGALLAIVGIEVFWNGSGVENFSIQASFMVAFLAFLIPITDTTTVTINRLMRGQSPFIGGRDHTTHHLSYLGLSDRAVAIALLVTNALSVACAATYLLYYDSISWPLWFFALMGILVLVTLYSITKISKPKK